MNLLLVRLAAVAAALLVAVPASAGTLDKIKESHRIAIGIRETAPPISYRNKEGQPAGYSVELCRRVVEGIGKQLGVAEIAIDYVPVTADDRIEAVRSGRIDIECGITTVTLSRQEQVDFSYFTFVTGTELLSRADDQIYSVSQLANKKVAVIAGTTNEAALTGALRDGNIQAEMVKVKDHKEGVEAVRSGRAAAYAADGVVLLGLALTTPSDLALTMSNEPLSYEPYALMMRRGDADFRLAVNRVLVALFRSGEIEQIFEHAFSPFMAHPGPVLKALYAIEAIQD
jgi:glutamate/aspartate transport system substrate-binding protein